MVSFRFHLVSVMAVFLGIALGIAIGVTVIDRKVVDVKNAQVSSLQRQLAAARSSRDKADYKVNVSNHFAQDVGDQLTRDRIKDQKVVFITSDGTSSDSINQVRDAVAKSGGKDQGLLTLTSKFSVTSDAWKNLMQVAGYTDLTPVQARKKIFDELVAHWKDKTDTKLPDSLSDSGFLNWKGVEGGPGSAKDLNFDDTKVVVIGDANTKVPHADLLVPFVTSLNEKMADNILATEVSEPDLALDDSQKSASFVQQLRNITTFNNHVSTVDHADTFWGRVAAILTLQKLREGKIGDFGSDSGASRAVPAG